MVNYIISQITHFVILLVINKMEFDTKAFIIFVKQRDYFYHGKSASIENTVNVRVFILRFTTSLRMNLGTRILQSNGHCVDELFSTTLFDLGTNTVYLRVRKTMEKMTT